MIPINHMYLNTHQPLQLSFQHHLYNNMLTLPVTAMYYPYLNTNQPLQPNYIHQIRMLNQLQWSSLYCPWSTAFKKVYNVWLNMCYLGGLQNQLQRSPMSYPCYAIFKKIYHVGVNMCFCYNTNPPPLPNIPIHLPFFASPFPTCIWHPYLHHNNLSFITKLHSLQITSIYHPYQPSLLASTFPT